MFVVFYRLQKNKEDDKINTEKQLEELRHQIQTSEEEIEKLKDYNASLEVNLLMIKITDEILV